jgi:ABC-type transport system involved in cytochrome c biogenesis permease subunit
MLSSMSGQGRIGEALTWASRIIAVGVAMFLPAVAGNWADDRLGTAFLGPAGLVVGFVAGLAWLVRIGRQTGAG